MTTTATPVLRSGIIRAALDLLDQVEAADAPTAFAIILTDTATSRVTVYGPYTDEPTVVQARRDAMLADVNQGVEGEPPGSRWAQPWTAIVAPIYSTEPTAADA